MKVETAIQYALLAGGLYLAYELTKGFKQIGATAGDIGNQVAELGDSTADPNNSTFASWYDPTTRTVFFYWLTFPNGTHHMVWNSSVQTDGTFTWDDSQTYRIGNDKAGGLRAYLYQL
jgi:hypothetical protein